LDAPAHRLLGRRVGGRYELLALVGRGAMADVFRARDVETDTRVAVKLVPSELVTSPVAAARFQREVKASSKLDHPAIVRVHAWGIDADHGYIVMDMVEGEDLYERLQRLGAIPVPAALEIAVKVLHGLEVAHAAGVIHRDLKPENIMLEATGQLRILDFGIAKLHRTGAREEETIPASLTQAGTAVGTPSHMAPEQARGGHVDGRADLYAVGVLLYEMVTGRLPFEGTSPIEVVMKQVRDLPTPPRHHDPSLPVALEAMILRALEKDPTSRPPNALAMRRALEAILAEIDDELEGPTQAERVSGRAVDEATTVDREDVRARALLTKTGATTVERWSDDEPTATVVLSDAAPMDEEATNVMPLPGRVGPSGTLVDDDGDARARELRLLEQGPEETERLDISSAPWTPPAEAPVAPEGMPSLHAWNQAPMASRPAATSELDVLLRQVPAPPISRWRAIAVAAVFVVALGALLWALVV
jgi:serine/threonine protein kinase